MSTKTTFKRIALVAVAALGLGVLTSVAPANAAAVGADTTNNPTVTAITVGTPGAVRAGSTVYVPVTVTATWAATKVANLRAIGVSAPTGSTFLTATTGKSFTFGAGATAPAAGAISKWFATGPNAATAGAVLATGDGNSAATAGQSATYSLTSGATSGTSIKAYFAFTPDVAGVYTFTVYNESNDNATLSAGEVSSSLGTVTTANAPASATVTVVSGGVVDSVGSAAGALLKVELKDAAGVRTTLSNSEAVTLTSSATAMTLNGGSTSLVASDFGAGTPDSGYFLFNATATAAATYSATVASGGALGAAFTTTVPVTFTATTSSAATATATDSTSAIVISANAATGLGFVGATTGASQATTARTIAGAAGTGLYVVPASSVTWTITDTATADAAIKIWVTVTEVGGSITGVPGASASYTKAVTLTAGVGTLAIAPVATAASGTDAFVGYKVQVHATGASAFFGASIVATGGTPALTRTSGATVNTVAGAVVNATYTLTDGFGAAVAGAAVSFTVTGRNTVVKTGVTDASGVVTVSYTDAATVATATADSIAATAVYFRGVTSTSTSASAVTVNYAAANAVSTVKLTSDNYSVAGTANDTVSPQTIDAGVDGASATLRTITATVKNADGVALSGVSVVFTVAGTGAAIPSNYVTAVTGSTGVATSKIYAWLNGTYTVTATAGGKTGTATETFAQSTASSVRTVSATADANRVTATVKDRYGNPVSGVTIYAKIGAGSTGYFGNGVVSTSSQSLTDGTAVFVVSGGDATVTVSTISFSAPAGTTGLQVTAAKGYDIGGAGATALTATTVGTIGTAETGVGASYDAAGVASATVSVAADAASVQSQAAADAAAEATDAANAATDAANAAAEAADAATAAAQDAADAVAALSTQVTEMVSALKKQITALTNLVIKIQKKVKA